jgi:hypothetical protein
MRRVAAVREIPGAAPGGSASSAGAMPSRREIDELLEAVASHEVDPAEAADRLSGLPFRDLGFARVDTCTRRPPVPSTGSCCSIGFRRNRDEC